MNPSVKFALFFSLSAIVLRLVAFYGGFVTASTGQYVIFMHMLFILLCVFFALRNTSSKPKDDKDRLADDLKTGAKAGGVYAIINTAFVYVYFKFIDTAYFPAKREMLIAGQLKKGGLDPEKVRQKIEGFFSLTNYTTVTLVGLMATTLLYTVVLVVINRYVLEKVK